IMYLAPANTSGFEVCPMRSYGCTAVCLYHQGRARHMSSINEARLRKTNWFFRDRPAFMAALCDDIETMQRRARRNGMLPAVRLNGTSDILFERIPIERHGVRFDNVMSCFPLVQFYDYTKHTKARTLPRNYDLTFSRSEQNDAEVSGMLARGFRV